MMERIDNSKISSAMNSPMDIEEDASSAAMNASEAGGEFSGEPNEARSWRCCQRKVKRARHYSNQSYDQLVPHLKKARESYADELLGASVSTTVMRSEMPSQSTLQLEKDRIGHQQNDEVVQGINYLEEISNAVKEKKWEALDGLLNNVINSDMNVEELISITKKIQEFEIESEKRTYELGNNLNEVFKFSVEYDQVALVKVLIKIGFNANYGDTDSRHMNPMGYAVYFGNIKMVELMLSLGADINPCLCNPLLTAVTKKNFYMVKLLLSKGADPNRKCHGCDYPLHAAIEECCSDIVMLLLEYGKADSNVVKNSDSALSMAVRKDDVRCVELLLGKKASLNNKFVYVNMLSYSLANANIHIAVCLILAGAKFFHDNDAVVYNKLLLAHKYDNGKGPLTLMSLSYRTINPYFHRCKSVEERKIFSAKLGIPELLQLPFFSGLSMGTTRQCMNGKSIDVSVEFYRH